MDSKRWLIAAMDLKRRIAAAPANRLSIIADEAASTGRAESTLRRQVLAVDHVMRWSALEGLELDSLKPALTSIETLRRLEEIAPSQAATVRHDVLVGKLAQRELTKILKNASRPPEKKLLDDLINTSIGLAEYADLSIESVTPRGSKSITHAGRVLDVDAEIEANKELVAIFISPSIVADGRKTATFGAQLFKIFASLHFYDKVIVGCSKQEGKEIFDLATESRFDSFPANLSVFEL